MVGRDPELSLGVSVLSSALVSRHPALLGWWAPAGTGKTRLVEGIASSMSGTDFAMIEADDHPGSHPFSSFLRSWFGTGGTGPDHEASIQRFDSLFDGLETAVELAVGSSAPLLRELRRTRPWLGDLAGIADSDLAEITEPALRSGGLADAVTAFMMSLAAMDPLVVVLENLHLFTEFDLSVTERLIEASQGLSISFLATSRPAEGGSEPKFPLSSSLHERIVSKLEGLPRESLPGFVAGFTGMGPGRKLEELLWIRAGGVPLLLEHTLDFLDETGSLLDDRSVLELREDAPELPDTIRGLLAARMELMRPDFRRMIRAAAVLGRGISPSLLSTMIGIPVTPELLSEGVRRHILTPEDGSFAFAHTLLRQAVLGAVPEAEREALHLSAAAAIEAAGGHTAAIMEETGDHFLLGGEPEEAVIRLERAALEYASGSENTAAIEVRRRMAALLEEPARTENLLALVEVQCNSGLMSESIEILTRAIERNMEEVRIDGSLRARLTMHLGMCLGSTGRLAEARGFLQQVLPVFEELGDGLNMCIALRHIGMVELSAGETEAAIGHLEESVHMARIIGLPAEICSSLYWSAIAYRQTGDLDRMRSCTEEQVSLAEESGLLKSRISGYDNLMRLHIYTAEYELATEVHALLVETAERCGNWAALSAAASKMGIIHLRREEWVAAAECFNRCVTLTGRTGNLRARCAALGNLAHVSLGMQDLDAAMRYSTQLIDTSSAIGFRLGLMSGYARMAYIFSEKGAWEPALDCLETQMEHAGAMGDSRNLSDGHATRARILLTLDRQEEALVSVNRAIEVSEGSGAVRLLAGQLELRGRLLYLLGRPGDAGVDLRRSLGMTEGTAGREKVAFRSGLFLEATLAASGDRDAAGRLLAMLDDAPDESCATDLLYTHWSLTGDGVSAAGARSGLEGILAKREQPLARRMLDTVDASNQPVEQVIRDTGVPRK